MANHVVIDPVEHTGNPIKPGVYVTTMKGKPLVQAMRYFDGRHWGHPADDYLLALQGLRVGDKLPFYKQQLRGTVAHWQIVTVTPVGKAIIWEMIFGGNP